MQLLIWKGYPSVTDNNRPLVRIEGLTKHFPILRGMFIKRPVGYVKAVDNISFDIYPGETMGLVGESGCGKTTAGRTILQLYDVTAGKVIFDEIDLTAQRGDSLRNLRPRIQMIFQDPYASLNPRMTVGDLIAEPLLIHSSMSRSERTARVHELLELVGLNPRFDRRYPHEFSGGQRQRIGIARALALEPEFIVCDEPISALDVSVQAQVVNLLEDLQEKLGLTYLFIAHDLSMVRHISTRVAVMYLGKIMELAERDELYDNPMHPYAQALLSAVPVPDPAIESKRRRIILEGDVPSPSAPPPGCVFHTRCPLAIDICKSDLPEFREVREGHMVACHLVESEIGVDDITTINQPNILTFAEGGGD
jgi:oligopeptide transport system ATP-binding protein